MSTLENFDKETSEETPESISPYHRIARAIFEKVKPNLYILAMKLKEKNRDCKAHVDSVPVDISDLDELEGVDENVLKGVATVFERICEEYFINLRVSLFMWSRDSYFWCSPLKTEFISYSDGRRFLICNLGAAQWLSFSVPGKFLHESEDLVGKNEVYEEVKEDYEIAREAVIRSFHFCRDRLNVYMEHVKSYSELHPEFAREFVYNQHIEALDNAAITCNFDLSVGKERIERIQGMAKTMFISEILNHLIRLELFIPGVNTRYRVLKHRVLKFDVEIENSAKSSETVQTILKPKFYIGPEIEYEIGGVEPTMDFDITFGDEMAHTALSQRKPDKALAHYTQILKRVTYFSGAYSIVMANFLSYGYLNEARVILELAFRDGVATPDMLWEFLKTAIDKCRADDVLKTIDEMRPAFADVDGAFSHFDQAKMLAGTGFFRTHF